MIHKKEFAILSFFLLIIFLILALNTWDAKSCFNPDEHFYYKSSQTLYEPKNLFAPEYYGEPRFQKPPLFYLAVFFAFKLFGTNWFSARLVTVISSIMVLLVTYALGLKMFDARKAFFGTAMLATSALFLRFGRIVLPEMMLVLCMTSAFYFVYRYFSEGTVRFFYMAFIFMGIGTLIKGPIAILLPALSIFVFYRIYKKKDALTPLHWACGLSIALGLSLIWLIPTLIMHGCNFMDHVMKYEVSARLIEQRTNGATPMGALLHHINKLIFYVPVVFMEYLPWSVLVPAILFLTGKKLNIKKYVAGRSFLLVWIITGFLIFTIVPAKRSHYVLTFFPALSLYLASFFDFDKRRLKNIFTAFLSVTICVYIFAILIVFPLILNDGVDRLSTKLNDILIPREGRVGVSWRLDPQKVELYIDRPIYRMSESDFTYRSPCLLPVLYILAAEYEFNKYMIPLMSSEDVAKYLCTFSVLAEDWRWRKKIPFRKCISDILKDPKNTGHYLTDAFQEKIYLIRVNK